MDRLTRVGQNKRYHFVFSHKTEQIYSLVQLATGMAMDLSLHREQKRMLVIPGRLPLPPEPAWVQRERQRTLLGCYYLSSAYVSSLTFLSIEY